MRSNHRRVLILTCSLLLTAATASAHELTNGRITVVQADGSNGYNTTTQDRVDSISWINGTGNSTGNLASNGGPASCGDPSEFFGESYDDHDFAGLFLVNVGATATWKSNNAVSGTSKTTSKDACLTLSGKTTTSYQLSSSKAKVNEMRIQRTFKFNSQVQSEPYNIRAYVMRLPLSTYTTVLYPDAAGDIKTLNVLSCPMAQAQGCEISDWNGQWFADDNGGGYGIVLIRDKSSTWPAEIAADYDSNSHSNNTSIILMKPTDGWAGQVKETEWLCFYDPTSWPADKRSKGKLPQGCAVKMP